MSATYLHRGEHPAFVLDKPLEKGQVVPVPLWPQAKAGDEMRCGTCGERLNMDELNAQDMPLQKQN